MSSQITDGLTLLLSFQIPQRSLYIFVNNFLLFSKSFMVIPFLFIRGNVTSYQIFQVTLLFLKCLKPRWWCRFLVLVIIGEIGMISPPRVVSIWVRIILRVDLWSLEAILASILELILNWSLKSILIPLKITHEIYLVIRCTYLAVHAIMISTTKFTAYHLMLWSIHLI